MHSAALTTLPVNRHNTLASISVVFSSISGAVGTPLLGLLLQRYGGVSAFSSLFILFIILALGSAALRRIRSTLGTESGLDPCHASGAVKTRRLGV